MACEEYINNINNINNINIINNILNIKQEQIEDNIHEGENSFKMEYNVDDDDSDGTVYGMSENMTGTEVLNVNVKMEKIEDNGDKGGNSYKMPGNNGDEKTNRKMPGDEVLNVNGCLFYEQDICRDINDSGVFILKIKESTQRKRGKDFQGLFACHFCSKLIRKNFDHYQKVHKNEMMEIFALPPTQRKKEIKKLSVMGNHAHNIRVLNKKEGVFLLGRRHQGKQFDVREYGPCPMCSEWLILRFLARHALKCPARPPGNDAPLSYHDLRIGSNILSNRLNSNASDLLITETFTSMVKDRISDICQSDRLLIELGNYWIEKANSSKNRKHITAQVMRLLARMMVHVRETIGNEEITLWDMISPTYFDDVIKAVFQLAGWNGGDTLALGENEDRQIDRLMVTPSNFLKLGHLLKRVTMLKKTEAEKAGDGAAKEEAGAFLDFLQSQHMTGLMSQIRKYSQDAGQDATEDVTVGGECQDNGQYNAGDEIHEMGLDFEEAGVGPEGHGDLNQSFVDNSKPKVPF